MAITSGSTFLRMKTPCFGSKAYLFLLPLGVSTTTWTVCLPFARVLRRVGSANPLIRAIPIDDAEALPGYFSRDRIPSYRRGAHPFRPLPARNDEGYSEKRSGKPGEGYGNGETN